MNPVAPFSVLLSVYDKNLPNQFDQAIKSIWYDQKLKPAQVVIVEDGRLSKELESVIDYWSNLNKDVFTIVKLSSNQGLAAALNQGISYCRYNLIARMDADDVSLPDRFIRQYNYMIHHPEIDVLGGQIEEWDEKLEKRLAQKFLPLSDNELKFFTKYRCPFNHPTVMYRKDVVCQVGGYKNKKLEDNYLWINLMLNGSKFANLKFVLVKMRADQMIKGRRGFSVLVPELKLQKYLYDKGINNLTEFLLNCFFRIILRSVPYTIRVFLYKHLR